MIGDLATQVLDPFGLATVKEGVQKVLTAFSATPFTTLLIGSDFTQLTISCNELKQTAATVYRSIMALETKVKKWKAVPLEIKEVIKTWRGKATC